MAQQNVLFHPPSLKNAEVQPTKAKQAACLVGGRPWGVFGSGPADVTNLPFTPYSFLKPHPFHPFPKTAPTTFESLAPAPKRSFFLRPKPHEPSHPPQPRVDPLLQGRQLGLRKNPLLPLQGAIRPLRRSEVGIRRSLRLSKGRGVDR